MSKTGRYLEIKFHDNDFGNAIDGALHKIWEFVTENNPTSSDVLPSSYPDMFLKLHEKGVLKKMIHALIVFEASSSPIERITRGLGESIISKDKKLSFDWIKMKEKDLDNIFTSVNFYREYFENLAIEFHNDGKFAETWKNGEHAYLDMITGFVAVF